MRAWVLAAVVVTLASIAHGSRADDEPAGEAGVVRVTTAGGAEIVVRSSRPRPWAGEVVEIEYSVLLARHDWGELGAGPVWADAWEGARESWIAEAPTHPGGRLQQTFRTRIAIQRAGPVKLPPLVHRAELGDFRRDSPNRGKQRPVELRSGRLGLDVRRLPTPAPAGFTGAVGQFELESILVPTEVGVGSPVTWTLRLMGRGSWPHSGLPRRSLPDGVSALEPHRERSFEDARVFSGRSSEDWVVTPRSAGVVELDPARLDYFDPARGVYAVAVAPALRLRVVAAAGPSGDPMGLLASPTAAVGTMPLGGGQVVAGLLIPCLCVAMLWLALAVHHMIRTDPARHRGRALSEVAACIRSLRAGVGAGHEVRALLLRWQRAAVTGLALDLATPTAQRLQALEEAGPAGNRSDWVRLWRESERAIYSASGSLPPDWCDRAEAARLAVRLSPRRAGAVFSRVHWLPVVGMMLLAGFPGTTGAVASLETERARIVARVGSDPLDWVARYNLGRIEGNLGHRGSSLGHALAAFLQAPRHPAVRSQMRGFVERRDPVDPSVARLLSGEGVSRLACWLPPWRWQQILLGAGLALCGVVAMALLRRHGWLAAGGGAQWRWAAWLTAALAIATLWLAARCVAEYGIMGRRGAAVVMQDVRARALPTDVVAEEAEWGGFAGGLVEVEGAFLGWRRVRGQDRTRVGWLRAENLVPLYLPPR